MNLRLPRALKALSDPTRLSIFEMLADYEMCVCEIAARLNLSQPLASHHLRELKIADLVIDRRQGNWIYYRVNAQTAFSMKDDLQHLFSKISTSPKTSDYSCDRAKMKELAHAE